MAPLAAEFTKSRKEDDPLFPTAAEHKFLVDRLGINVADDEYARNLERLMELFYSLRFSLSRSKRAGAATELAAVEV